MTFAEGVRKAINDETAAARMYAQLADMAPLAAFAARIRCIRDDELHHAHMFSSFLAMSMASGPPGPDEGVTAGSFTEGLNAAIAGELDAIRFYAELADMSPNLDIREHILCIQKDEMEHAKIFEFMKSVMIGGL
ncbi:MAG: ferritin-like domain-containing protein [Firmicutes bacterium]|nr:ferritin-like domain-containing protein [Bacillota bacterium]